MSTPCGGMIFILKRIEVHYGDPSLRSGARGLAFGVWRGLGGDDRVSMTLFAFGGSVPFTSVIARSSATWQSPDHESHFNIATTGCPSGRDHGCGSIGQILVGATSGGPVLFGVGIVGVDGELSEAQRVAIFHATFRVVVCVALSDRLAHFAFVLAIRLASDESAIL